MVKIRTTVVSQTTVFSSEFKDPTKFFIQNAMGEFVFFHTFERSIAQEKADEMYGKGKYMVRTSRLDKGKGGDLTCTGSNTRKCFAPRLRDIK